MLYSNIVPEDKVRSTQREALKVISKALEKSFGPKGSSTAIVKGLDSQGKNLVVQWTKDGHTIIDNIQFINPIERSVAELLNSLTWYIVKEVGDGTTSAVILCKTLFDSLCESNIIKDKNPADVAREFSSVIDAIKANIMSKARPCTIDDIYNIALISTNNDEAIASTIKQIYDKFGLDVDIDVMTSNTVEHFVKEYDGMVLDTPFADQCMVNNKHTNSAIVPNPKIYCFEDPIDTPEMLGFLDKIICDNIMRAYTPGSVYEPVPTVVLCHKLSPDTSSFFEPLVKLMNAVPNVPFLLVSDIHQDYLYEDIVHMTGAKFIKKYIHPDIQKDAVAKGLAPTVDTILDFCGHAEAVEANESRTKIINPAKMTNPDGTLSDEYNSYVNYLQSIVDKLRTESAKVREIQEAERRLNSFKGKNVQFLVGGITTSDRENTKAAVEDAVFNCRSAAKYGVGYGANYMAYSAIKELFHGANSKDKEYYNIIYRAYINLISILYDSLLDKEDDIDYLDDFLDHMDANGCPLNIRTGEYDHKVLSSIRSDVIILETIQHILMNMFTCNQYLVQTPNHNVYIAENRD